MQGVTQLHDGAVQLDDGLASAKDGADQLVDGAGKLHDGSSTLYFGLVDADNGAQQLATGASQLKDGASQLNDGAVQLKDGLSQAVSGTADAKAGADKLVDGAAQLHSGSSELYFGVVSGAEGAKQLDDGAAQLVDGLKTSQEGVTKLNSGAGDLLDGMKSLDDGAATLVDGTKQLYDGSVKLTDGLSDAKDGADQLHDGLKNGIAGMAGMDEEVIDARSSMMSQPVEVNEDNYTTVANYGTGFSPYFISLGLWVGALMSTFLVKPLNNRLISSGANPIIAAFCGYVPVLIVGVVQSVLLCLVIQFVLGFTIDYPIALYLFTILSTMAFVSILQMFMAAFGFPGKFAAIIFLMLQLTSCDGTFPIETCPEFFQAISPYMPMTYVVAGLRHIISGVTLAPVALDVVVLALCVVVPFAITCLVARHRRTVSLNQLHPLIEL